MGLYAFSTIGSFGLLFHFESSSEFALGVFVTMTAILAGISSYGFWKKKAWVIRVFALWGLSGIPAIIAMRYYSEALAVQREVPVPSWNFIAVALVVHFIYVGVVLMYVYSVLRRDSEAI